MKTMLLRVLAVVVVLTPAVVFSQGARTKPTTATYITNEEIDLVNKQGQGTDRNIRSVDIGHEHFSVGIIHRGKKVDGVQVDIPEHVDYLSFRPSPGILTAGWVHPVLRK